jgi:hypothetical protein
MGSKEERAGLTEFAGLTRLYMPGNHPVHPV